MVCSTTIHPVRFSFLGHVGAQVGSTALQTILVLCYAISPSLQATRACLAKQRQQPVLDLDSAIVLHVRDFP
jgi:hypothetical protein